VDVAAARKALEEAPGVSLKDDPENLVRVVFVVVVALDNIISAIRVERLNSDSSLSLFQPI
jgi:hypothetical protein